MRTQTTDDQDTLRFRAPSLEEAVALAEQSLGTRVRVVAANRIRRGGVGGFFAADLGVEVIVTPATETVEDALERLINESADDERTQWHSERGEVVADTAAASPTDGFDMPGRRWLLDQAATLPAATNEAIQAALAGTGERRSRRTPVTPIDPSDPTTNTSSWWEPPTGAVNGPTETGRSGNSFNDLVARLAAEDERERAPRTVDVIDLLAALARGGDGVDLTVDPTPTTEVPVIAAPAAPTAASVESPGLIRVEKIIEELQALTASPRLLTAMKQRQAEAPSSVLAEPDADVADASEAVMPETVAPKGALLGTPRALTSTDAPVDVDPASAEMTIEVEAEVDDMSADQMAPGSGPSQRQVELAVAAADQLIESLTRDETVKRLSVRIVLRTAGNDEVEAGAEWESNG